MKTKLEIAMIILFLMSLSLLITAILGFTNGTHPYGIFIEFAGSVLYFYFTLQLRKVYYA